MTEQTEVETYVNVPPFGAPTARDFARNVLRYGPKLAYTVWRTNKPYFDMLRTIATYCREMQTEFVRAEDEEDAEFFLAEAVRTRNWLRELGYNEFGDDI